MLPFRPITISDKPSADVILKPLKSLSCAHSFTDLFIWQYVYDSQVCFEGDFLLVRQKLDGRYIYTIPLGQGDLGAAVQKLMDDARERGIPFVMSAVNENQKNELEKSFPDLFLIEGNRDYQDYIYTAESLMTLGGKKLHSKRNFINRFKTVFDGKWEYHSITKENIHQVFEYHLEWCSLNNDEEDSDFFGETGAISLALKNFDALGLDGGFLTVGGKIIAFTLGSKANELVYIVHIEKADHTIAGSYQMINNLFALENFKDVQYVNREEDLGIEGLRKAKLSYYPAMLGDNFTVTLR